MNDTYYNGALFRHLAQLYTAEEIESAVSRGIYAILKKAVEQDLTERQRQALLLHYGESMPQKSIAALWRVHPSAVCRHIQKGKKRLKKLLTYANLRL